MNGAFLIIAEVKLNCKKESDIGGIEWRKKGLGIISFWERH